MPASAPSSAIRSRLSEVGRRGLDHDRVAGRERGAQLPRRHLGRVVPRDDGADDADRLAGDRRDRALGRGRDLAVQLVDGLGVPPDAGRGLRHVEADGVGDRLAGVDGLDDPQLAAVGLDQVRPADQDPLAIARAQARPAPVVGGSPRGGDREVHIGRSALRDLGDRPSGRRVLGDEPPASLRIAEVAVDEQLRPEAQAIDLGPRLVDGGDQGLGHRGFSGWTTAEGHPLQALRRCGHSLAHSSRLHGTSHCVAPGPVTSGRPPALRASAWREREARRFAGPMLVAMSGVPHASGRASIVSSHGWICSPDRCGGGSASATSSRS